MRVFDNIDFAIRCFHSFFIRKFIELSEGIYRILTEQFLFLLARTSAIGELLLFLSSKFVEFKSTYLVRFVKYLILA